MLLGTAAVLAGCGASTPISPASSAGGANPSTALSSGQTAAASTASTASAKPAASASAARIKLEMAYASISGTQMIPYISKGAGLFDKYGLDVNLSFIAPNTLTAGVLSGSLNMAYGPANSVATARVQGGDLIVAGGPYAGPTFSIVASPSIKTLQDLRGKKVTVTQRASSADLLLSDLLKKQGLTSSDYTVVAIPETANEIAALTAGAVDAAVLPEPSSSIAVSQGAHVIFDSQQGTDYITLSVLMLKKSFLASNREAVKRVLMANLEAVHLLKTNTDQMAQYVAPFLKIDDLNIVRSSMRSYLPSIRDDMTFPIDRLQQIIDETASTVPAVAQVKAQDLVDFSVIDELKTSHFLETLK